jgi:hypothetical protein
MFVVVDEAPGQFAGMLTCEACGDTELLHDGDHGRYLRSGWPLCCGRPMGWAPTVRRSG